MRLVPSIRYNDATGTTHGIPIACVDTCAAQEPLIDRAVSEALALGGSGVRIEFIDEGSGLCKVRVRVR